jgi:vacuolar-type H+-ATPase subunit E/Vma4
VALPQLLEALREEAEARRRSELARADALAERIRARSRGAIDQRRAELLSGARREAEEAAQRAASAARADGAERVLVARARLLARVRDVLERRIRQAADDTDCLEALARDVGVALERLPPGPIVVRARPELVSRISDAVRARNEVRIESSEDLGVGFTASSPEHGVEVDGRLEARLEYAWPRLAVTVLGEVEP